MRAKIAIIQTNDMLRTISSLYPHGRDIARVYLNESWTCQEKIQFEGESRGRGCGYISV
jgi:hypothetical protein